MIASYKVNVNDFNWLFKRGLFVNTLCYIFEYISVSADFKSIKHSFYTVLRHQSLIVMLLRQHMGRMGRFLVPVLDFLSVHDLRHYFHTFPGDNGITITIVLGHSKLCICSRIYWMCNRVCDLSFCSHLIRLDVNIKTRSILWMHHWPALSLTIWCRPQCDPAKLCFHSPRFHKQQHSVPKAHVAITTLAFLSRGRCIQKQWFK